MKNEASALSAFTIIELSIVLVIIGLIVGGVLVGQDLIKAATLQAQITQITQYNTAANTFRAKYGYLPGDMPPADATTFDFSRTAAPTQGNGDGVLQNSSGAVTTAPAGNPAGGETMLFWTDLFGAGLIADTPVTNFSSGDTTTVPAKIGNGNGIYVFSGGYWNGGGIGWNPNGINYFGLSAALTYSGGADLDYSNPGLTVAQAYAIDKKIDDGLPQLGNVIAAYINAGSNGYGSDDGGPVWVNPGGGQVPYYGLTTAATQGTSTTCYDNGNTLNATQQYSMAQNNGTGVNCALSFQVQF